MSDELCPACSGNGVRKIPGGMQRCGECDGWGRRRDPEVIKELRAKLAAAEYTLLGVMHSVDKWLDGDELDGDEVNRACTMREKTLRLLEAAERERDEARALLRECAEALRFLDTVAAGDLRDRAAKVLGE